MKKQAILSLLIFVSLVGSGVVYRKLHASDHDDGENDVKSRALNLTDHYAFRDTDTSKLNLVQTSNPRALAGTQYFFSTQARYEIHVSRVADKTAAVTGSDDVIFRFEFGKPDSTNVQTITFTVIKDGATVGSDASAKTATIAESKATAAGAGGSKVYTIAIGGVTYKLFAGLREDTFHFDVQRFFEVRAFLASAFFGGVVATTPLADFQNNHKTCDNKVFLQGITGYDTTGGAVSASASNADTAHLFNPPSCAEDFTKNYNRNEIELQVPIASLQTAGQTTFDTWSTISIPQ